MIGQRRPSFGSISLPVFVRFWQSLSILLVVVRRKWIRRRARETGQRCGSNFRGATIVAVSMMLIVSLLLFIVFADGARFSAAMAWHGHNIVSGRCLLDQCRQFFNLPRRTLAVSRRSPSLSYWPFFSAFGTITMLFGLLLRRKYLVRYNRVFSNVVWSRRKKRWSWARLHPLFVVATRRRWNSGGLLDCHRSRRHSGCESEFCAASFCHQRSFRWKSRRGRLRCTARRAQPRFIQIQRQSARHPQPGFSVADTRLDALPGLGATLPSLSNPVFRPRARARNGMGEGMAARNGQTTVSPIRSSIFGSRARANGCRHFYLNGTSVEKGNRIITSNLHLTNVFLDAEDAADKLAQHQFARHESGVPHSA